MSRPTARSPGWQVHRARRAGGGVLKRLPEGPPCHGIGWSIAMAISPHRPRSTAAASALLAEVCRSPAAAISISSIIAGFIEGKKPHPGRSELLGDRNGGLLDRNQRQVGMSAAPVYYRLHGIGNKHQLAVNRDRRA